MVKYTIPQDREEIALNIAEYITHSPEETAQLGRELAPSMESVSVIALYGGLGAGKTAFVSGVAQGFACRQRASSPTYNIVNEYYGSRRVCHFDMYRITDSERLYEIGWEEYVDSDALCIVEWSENIEDALPEDCWKIVIEKLSDTDRKIQVIKC